MAEPPPPAAASRDPNAVSSAYPPPPPFFHHFTPENLALLKEHRKLGTPDDQLPKELEYLIPPPPPAAVYRTFGAQWTIPDILPTLPDLGIQQLYEDPPAPPSNTDTLSTTDASGPVPPIHPSNTRALSLLRLSKSLLISYLELLSLLSINPVAAPHKLQDLRTILINMHHLINEYRPHQARETLVSMMEEQVRRCRKERDENLLAKERMKEVLEYVEGMLKGGLGVGGESAGEGEGEWEGWRRKTEREKEEEENERNRKRDMEMWRVLGELEGVSS